MRPAAADMQQTDLTNIPTGRYIPTTGGKLFAPEMMIANSPPLGLPEDPGFHRMLGAILALALVLYLVPRSAIFGAIVLTGYLGGGGRNPCPGRLTAGIAYAVRGLYRNGALGSTVVPPACAACAYPA